MVWLSALTTPREQSELTRALDEVFGKDKQNLGAAWTGSVTRQMSTGEKYQATFKV